MNLEPRNVLNKLYGNPMGKEFNLENIDIKGDSDVTPSKTNWLLLITVAASLATLYMFATRKKHA